MTNLSFCFPIFTALCFFLVQENITNMLILIIPPPHPLKNAANTSAYFATAMGRPCCW